MTELFTCNASYSAINTARSALSTLLVNESGITIGNSPLVKRFFKGIFELKPPLARYDTIWDVNIVLNFLKNLYPNCDYPLDIVTYKLVMLLALATKQRAQTLHAISVNDIIYCTNSILIPIKKLLKQSSRNNYRFQLYLTEYSDPSICVVQTLLEYVKRTKNLRGSHTQLFISFLKPYQPVSKSTISRWIWRVMTEAGIDTNIFKPHSTRSASVSAAKSNFPIDTILQSAGWSSCKTFHKFYDKIIMPC